MSPEDALLLIAIALGGALGALARFAAGGWIQGLAGSSFPWGTLVINVVGSLLLAFLYRLLEGVAVRPEWRALLAVGFCGAFTTFSTFSYETARMLQDGAWNRAVGYAGGSVVFGLVGTGLGLGIAFTVLQRG